MPQQQQKIKGNPASHRMMNKHRREHRAEMWAKQQERKRQNAAANRARAATNSAGKSLLSDANRISPWNLARIRRTNSPKRVEARKTYFRKQAAGGSR